MSRYTITVTASHRADPDAVIGYDPPLRTFFLQAFPDESGDDLALWGESEIVVGLVGEACRKRGRCHGS